MNIAKYNLFRARIIKGKHPIHLTIKAEDTHLIFIDCMIKGEKWATNATPIQPLQLKAIVNMMKDTIIGTVNKHYGEIVVTSIG